MAVIGSIFELTLWLYLLLLLSRLVADWVQNFAHAWSPRGPVLVGLEVVYSLTDPPIKLIRRVVPPLRLGTVALDLSIFLVLLAVYALLIVNRRTMPIA